MVRNRAKRIIREGYRQADAASPIRRGNLIVIVARSGIVKAKSQDIRDDMSAAFDKLGLRGTRPYNGQPKNSR